MEEKIRQEELVNAEGRGPRDDLSSSEKPLPLASPEEGDNGEAEEIALGNAYEETLKDLAEGEVVRGTIIRVTKDEVLVDVGYKSEGAIPLNEFSDPLEVRIGEEIDVYLERKENRDGLIVLSKRKADRVKTWQRIRDAYSNQTAIEGVVTKKIKGGLVVDIGVEAFLPASQVDLRPPKNLEQFIGQKLKAKIVKLSRKQGNIVLSRRTFLEEEKNRRKTETLASLKVGQIREGMVKNIMPFGAFIDLGGIDGLLHISDISWGKVNHPSEFLIVGEKVEVMVLNVDRKREKISLGLKQRTPNPWDGVEEKYPVGSLVRGKVVGLTDFGAFVRLEEGVEGLIHVSEMSWTRRIRHPSKVVAIGDIVEAVVLSIDKANKRISLGIKQIEPDPWSLVEEKYPVDSKVKGIVRNLTSFGAFVELEEGIDGLIHISDLSWTKRLNHPSEMLKKGDKVEVMVLSVDSINKKISLGLKQLTPDPWQAVPSKYKVGTMVRGKVVRLANFGAFIELEPGVEGLVHITQLARKRLTKPEEAVSVGEEHVMKVIKLHPKSRKIHLSMRAYQEEQERAEIEEYLKRQEELKINLGKLMGQDLKEIIKDALGEKNDKGKGSFPSEEREPQAQPTSPVDKPGKA